MWRLDAWICGHVAVHVLGICPLVGWNPEEDEHTLAVTGARVCTIGDGATMMVLVAK